MSPVTSECLNDSLFKAYCYTLQSKEKQQAKHLGTIAYKAFILGDTLLFKRANKKALTLSKARKDTAVIAYLYWNKAVYFLQKQQLDSAYIYYGQARFLYHQVNIPYYEGKMYYNMAFIKSRIKDYTGSEITLIKAIRLYRPLYKYKALYKSYNLLGALNQELEEYPKAILNLKKAQKYLHHLPASKQHYATAFIENNLGVIYHKQDREQRALKHFNKGLALLHNSSLYSPKLYARLIDNKAYSQLQIKDTLGVYQQLQTAIRIRDSLHHVPGVIISKLHLANYLLLQNDTIKSLAIAKEAYVLANHIQLNRDKIAALYFLANNDRLHSSTYFNKYIALSKAIKKKERRDREKFTKIQFNTQHYKKQNEQLSFKNSELFVGLVVTSIIALLLFVVAYLRSRNKQLSFENFQTKANEKIYNLTLKQLGKQEKIRFTERERIAQDLHDGVLGDLFGLRFMWSFLQFEAPPKAVLKHQEYLNSLQKVEENIRQISYNLNLEIMTKDLAGFLSMLKELIGKKQKIAQFNIKATGYQKIDWQEISPDLKINLYMILEEALQNAIKHANCSLVRVKFATHDHKLQLSVTDNGKLFKKNKDGMGLKNIKSRTKRLGGKFSLHTTDRGTSLIFNFPLL